MRSKRVYNKTVAISEEDLLYLKGLDKGKKSTAGVLSEIINDWKVRHKS